MDTAQFENARLALNLAVNVRSDDQSPAQVVTTARRFYKFLSAPEGAKEGATEE